MSFKYLTETPLKSSESLDFGHKEIVSTLNKIIVSQTWNITVGLFGNWGTGKSTIVESLREQLKPLKIPVVIFDVWKHDGDALRRTFLKECASQLNSEYYGNEYLDANMLLDDRLVSAKTKSEDAFSIKWKKLFKSALIATIFSIVFFFAAILIYGVLRLLSVDLLDYIKSAKLSSFILGGVTASLLFKFFESFIKTEKIDYREDKFQDPHEFEDEFRKLVGSLKNQPRKVVITFDNLDRVSGDSALSIISTIKTFLDFKCREGHPSTVVFLIPCDIDSMKRHIRQTMKSKEGVEDNLYIDEFLRKFFNTSIWIPEFHGTDLEKFATSKLAETGIPEFSDSYLSWLIIKVFNKNPRQIIQFVNHLVSNYLLLEEVCLQNGLSDSEFHKNNVSQLAKFLLIKQRHPDYLELYRSSRTYVLETEEMLIKINDGAFRDLLRQTADINIPSLEPYFKGRVTLEEQQFPGIVKLLELMKYDVGEHLDYAKSLQLAEHSIAFDSILKAEFNRLSNIIGKTLFLNHLLDLTAVYNITLSQGFYRDIINFVLNETNTEVFYKVNARHLMPEIFAKGGAAITQNDQKRVIGQYLNIICNRKKDVEKIGTENSYRFFDQIFEFFTTNKTLFAPVQISRLKKYLTENTEEFDLRKHFFKNQEIQKIFIDDTLIEHFISSFSISDTYQAFYQRLELVHQFHPQFDHTETILKTYGQFWDKMFIYDLAELADSEEIITGYIRILTERIEMATISNQELTNELIESIYRHISRQDETKLSAWITVIHRLLAHQVAIPRMSQIISDVLISSHEWNISTLLSLFPQRNRLLDIDSVVTDSYLTYIAKLPFDEDNYSGLSNEAIRQIIEKLVNWRNSDLAADVITKFRDQFEMETKENLFIFLKEAIVEAIDDKEPVEQIERCFKLMLLITDLDPNSLEQSGFWNLLPDLLKNNSSEHESALAKRLLLEHEQMLSPQMTEGLFNTLINSMDVQGIYNNDQFHETLNILCSKVPKQCQELYIDRILSNIVRFTSSHNITLLASEAIEKTKFNVDAQLLNILDLENYINVSMAETDRDRVKPVLRSLIKVLRRKQKVQLKELTIRLEELSK